MFTNDKLAESVWVQTPPALPDILRTCRTIAREARLVFLANTTLHITLGEVEDQPSWTMSTRRLAVTDFSFLRDVGTVRLCAGHASEDAMLAREIIREMKLGSGSKELQLHDWYFPLDDIGEVVPDTLTIKWELVEYARQLCWNRAGVREVGCPCWKCRWW